jgi:hypothetical protein
VFADSNASEATFVVEHPDFGTITFVFDNQHADGGFAATDGFVFFGIRYPKFVFGFKRQASGFVSCELNEITSQMLWGQRRTISEIAPPAFRSFVLSKAKLLANTL